jgi:hypothetical protein
MNAESLAPIDVAVSLADKYRLDCKTALISGRQALVRLPIAQRELDRARGLKTAGMISGYRGSPLGSSRRSPGRSSSISFQAAKSTVFSASGMARAPALIAPGMRSSMPI